MPARSPMPLIVPCTQRAPARTAATAARGCEAEVVVPVEVHRHVRPDPLDRSADQVGDRLRRGDPERVDDGDLVRARLDGALVDLLVEVRLRARRVDAEEGRVDPVLGGEAHRSRDPVEHLLAGDADRLELQVGDRRLDHRRAHAELDERLEVGRARRARSPRPPRRGRHRRSAARRPSRPARRAGSRPRSGRSRARRAAARSRASAPGRARRRPSARRRAGSCRRARPCRPRRYGSFSSPVQIIRTPRRPGRTRAFRRRRR